MNEKVRKELQEIIKEYKYFVREIDKKAKESTERAYGGILRAGKGKLVEHIAEQLVKIAWKELRKEEHRLSFKHNMIKIPIDKNYVNKIKSLEVRKYILANIKDMYYAIKPDIQVYVDNKFKISIECKAYTENAMFKRILVDCTLIKHVFPDVKFVLLQLESQLGGDYSKVGKKVHFGSPTTHTLLSYFDIDLNIITLLEGERRVDEPIHKTEFFKPLRINALVQAIDVIKEILE